MHCMLGVFTSESVFFSCWKACLLFFYALPANFHSFAFFCTAGLGLIEQRRKPSYSRRRHHRLLARFWATFVSLPPLRTSRSRQWSPGGILPLPPPTTHPPPLSPSPSPASPRLPTWPPLTLATPTWRWPCGSCPPLLLVDGGRGEKGARRGSELQRPLVHLPMGKRGQRTPWMPLAFTAGGMRTSRRGCWHRAGRLFVDSGLLEAQFYTGLAAAAAANGGVSKGSEL